MSQLLVDTADAAYPFDYELLPPRVRVVLGYVGESGETPHIWSTQEVAACRAAGLTWCPIIVPPQRALTRTDGIRAAQAMARALPQYGYGKGGPVFLDVERGSYDADPAGARDAVYAWRAGMRRAGWPDAYAYWPGVGVFTWCPDWTGHRPDTLSDGVAGVQYAHADDDHPYDRSVFHPAVFPTVTPTGKDPAMQLDKDDQAWLVEQLGQVQANLDAHLSALHHGKAGRWDYAANLVEISKAVRAAGVPGTPAATVTADTARIAAAIADALGPRLAGQVAAELSRRLSA